MNLSLLLPIGLSALAALLIPLLIHLVRRNEQRLVAFAALRWLATKPQPRRKHRFEEWLLLVLRLLLLVALALLLAEPVLLGRPDRTPWVVVAPGADPEIARESIGAPGARLHWLTPGFPAVAPPGPAALPAPADAATTPTPVGSLLRELDARLPTRTPLTVLVPAVFDGADAERPVLSRQVEWKVVASAANPSRPDNAAKATDATIPPPQVMVRHSPEQKPALRYLRAAGAAWLTAEKPTSSDRTVEPASDAAPTSTSPAPASTARASETSMRIAAATEPLDPDIPNLVWLVPGPLPTAVRGWVEAGGKVLLHAATDMPELRDGAVLLSDERGPLVRGARLGRGRAMRLERELSPGAMPMLLEPTFPEHLRQLFAAPPPAPTRVVADAYTPRTGAAPPLEQPRSLAVWLAALIAALFVAERWVANGPRRRWGA